MNWKIKVVQSYVFFIEPLVISLICTKYWAIRIHRHCRYYRKHTHTQSTTTTTKHQHFTSHIPVPHYSNSFHRSWKNIFLEIMSYITILNWDELRYRWIKWQEESTLVPCTQLAYKASVLAAVSLRSPISPTYCHQQILENVIHRQCYDHRRSQSESES